MRLTSFTSILDRPVSAMEVTCSAPGKVILFGEHAVVYGTTAVAASISSCRMFSRIRCIEEAALDIHLHDFIKTNQIDPVRINLTELISLRSKPGSLLAPINPSESDLQILKSHITFPKPEIADGIYAICFLVSQIFPGLIWKEENAGIALPFAGFRIDIHSHQLPIGAGLGSSAAFSVAICGALLRLKAQTSNELSSIVEESELAAWSSDGVASTAPSSAFTDLINKWAFGNGISVDFTSLLYTVYCNFA